MQDNFVLYSNDLKRLYQFDPLNEKHLKANLIVLKLLKILDA